MTDEKLKLIKRQILQGDKIFEVMLEVGWKPELKPEPKINWFGQKIKDKI